MDPKEEFIHDYPKSLDTPWKENWYFNFIDRENRAWGINHISLMRHTNKGRFTAIHVVDDEILMHANLIDIEDLKETSDGALKFDFVEPFEKFKVTFNGPSHQVELNYDARFPVHEFIKPEGEGKALTVTHYEQNLFVKGTLTKDGKSRSIDCLGHRDHTWGYRDESKVSGWNWVCILLPDKSVVNSRVVLGEAFFGTGYVSTEEGNCGITRLDVEDTVFKDDAPVSSIYTGYDEKGRTWKFKSEMFSTLYLPMADKEGVAIHENFAEFTNLETGEKGYGIDEYLINPEM
jgi:hypothetical protein